MSFLTLPRSLSPSPALLTPSSAFTPPSPLRGRTSSCSTSSKSHAPCGVPTPGSTEHSPAQVVSDAAPAGREGGGEGGREGGRNIMYFISCAHSHPLLPSLPRGEEREEHVFHLVCPFTPSPPLPPSLPPLPPSLPPSLPLSLSEETHTQWRRSGQTKRQVWSGSVTMPIGGHHHGN